MAGLKIPDKVSPKVNGAPCNRQLTNELSAASTKDDGLDLNEAELVRMLPRG